MRLATVCSLAAFTLICKFHGAFALCLDPEQQFGWGVCSGADSDGDICENPLVKRHPKEALCLVLEMHRRHETLVGIPPDALKIHISRGVCFQQVRCCKLPWWIFWVLCSVPQAALLLWLPVGDVFAIYFFAIHVPKLRTPLQSHVSIKKHLNLFEMQMWREVNSAKILFLDRDT